MKEYDTSPCYWCKQALGPNIGGTVVDMPPLFQVFDVHLACLPALKVALTQLLEERAMNPEARLQFPEAPL